MATPQEMAKASWVGLKLGPGWERRLTAAIAKQIEMAIADEQERCCALVRENCPACENGVAGAEQHPNGVGLLAVECEYCGRIIAAIRASNQEPAP